MSVEQSRANNYAASIDACRTSAQACVFYYDALATYGPDGLEWRAVNVAILRRWKASTLERIKRAAWKQMKESQ